MITPKAAEYVPFDLESMPDSELSPELNFGQTLTFPLGTGRVVASMWWHPDRQGGMWGVDFFDVEVECGTPEDDALEMLLDRIGDLMLETTQDGLTFEDAAAVAMEFHAIATGRMTY